MSHVPTTKASTTRMTRILPPAFVCAVGYVAIAALAAAPAPGAPDARALLAADQADGEWLLPAKSYLGNRYTGLSRITPENVTRLGLAWKTPIVDDGQQEASPVVSGGTMFISTPHNNVLALDAATGKLKWQFAYNPPVILYPVSRGVGVADGKVLMGTLDCRVIALDAATGKEQWNVPGCHDDSNSWFSMASYVYKGNVILGTAGGDNGSQGYVSAFSLADGKKQWDWATLKRDTWPGDSWKHGGAAVWTGMAIDPKTDTLFVAPGNPGPDMVLDGRKGPNLYSNSLVALDMSGKAPRVKWHYQIVPNDTHDIDPAMVPVLFRGTVGGKERDLVAVGDKAGTFLIFDRTNGKLLHRLAVSKQSGLDKPPTKEGALACPNHGGGIEWLGGVYDPKTNLFVIPSTDECGIWKLTTDKPEYIPGQVYAGGPLPTRQNGTGIVSAVDVSTGKIRWRNELPYPAQGGALITSTGIAFTTDLGGTLYAFDAATGKELWKTDTGSSIAAPLSTYVVDGEQYLALVVGQPGAQKTPNLPASKGSYVLAYKLDATRTAVNGTEGQTPLAAIPPSPGAAKIVGAGKAPYTQAQVERGQAVYATQCAACHGGQLQGVAAPALTGASFAKAHLNVSQLREATTTRMPMTAPGTLPADDYAALMAYMLAYNCVPPAGDGKIPFPIQDAPELAKVTMGAKSCPPSPVAKR
jgi:alcohol dehydrogenase (cytochrome c)